MSVCCTECFKDPHLRSVIEECAQLGNCPYCGTQDVYVSDINRVGQIIREKIEEHFEPMTFDPATFTLSPSIHPCCVLAVLRDDYEVFSDKLRDRYRQESASEDSFSSWHVNSEGYELVDDLLNASHSANGNERLLSNGWRSEIQLKSSGLYDTWSEFKHRVRHFSRYFDPSDQTRSRDAIIGQVIRFIVERLEAGLSTGDRVWRARIMNSGRFPSPPAWGSNDPAFLQAVGKATAEAKALCEANLGPAPLRVASNNRMSPAGISYMYLADSPLTAIAEIRPQVGDRVWVGEFEVTKQLRIADLSNERIFQQRSLFAPGFSTDEKPFSAFLKSFVQEVSRPIHPNESALEYVNTQVLCEIIRFRGFDGICFRSSVSAESESAGGRNYVLFCGPARERDDYDNSFALPNLPEFTDWVRLRECQERTVRGVSYAAPEASWREKRSF